MGARVTKRLDNMLRVPLTCPLPHRNTITTEEGKWHTIRWTKESRARALRDHYKLIPKEKK